jgi:hypothetical protein
MPGLFDAQGDQTVTSSFLTVAGLTGATTIRPEICEIKLGASGTPADNALVWLLQRYTAAGTSTGVTPSARNPANDGLHLASFGSNHTSEPTYTSAKLPFSIPPLHQKNSLIWQAYAGEGIVIPATANNGVGIQVKSSAYTSDVVAGMAWKE